MMPVLALREIFPLSEERWVEVGPSNSTMLGGEKAGDGVLAKVCVLGWVGLVPRLVSRLVSRFVTSLVTRLVTGFMA